MSLPNTPEQSQLGRASAYVDRYDASLLFPLSRTPQRLALGLPAPVPGSAPALPFFGADMWTAFELSWLNPRGKPQLAIAHFTFPCESPNIIESKSFKLYLNSFNSTVFADAEAVRERLRADLSEAAWRGSDRAGTVGVKLLPPDHFDREGVAELDGLDLDRLDLDCTLYEPAPELLTAAFDEPPVNEVLTSRLLKSNCRVTGQPDWGSVQIRYSGPAIDQAGLLRYIVSFRNHNEFHEPCCERIFSDILARCAPTKLAVYCRYTRRGGLDINPFRTSWPQALPANVRTARQ
ncbi:MAG: NADPH-dependent 7-cyano-7-deazaguanine reductase QueF [Rhodocyclaceae bacterium]|nr:NADPH-dependent 7-cyano-7-deazaguanine reductase QueF [Pseudomonadota bacterium]MDQ7973248.1 NADPH-dependent 7-cyano-7-deazaguanine reductase QueF [Rhodocyclaceae bacterium]MDQ7999111.1 NADPH-dependent 7-cyano-7-deazaguanine reductase QueF [Pseudomonadota bacterium]MDQ8019253.1 NADPH-dependent 7-cyano-7-deazaguanine reductase QueF [Pseudomonadota bacterium]